MRNSFLVPWRVFDPFDSVFDELTAAQDARPAAAFSPSHVEETKSHYIVEMDVPGVTKEDLQVSVEKNQLVITGERKGRISSKFSKSFYLPDDADVERIEAEHKNGVLVVAIPKAEKAIGRTIPIREGKEGLFSRLIGEDKKEA